MELKIILIMRRILLSLIKIYKVFVSPFLFNRCRFYPSCSSYAQDVVRYEPSLLFSVLKITKRLCRCHPFCEGGYDPYILKGKTNV